MLSIYKNILWFRRLPLLSSCNYSKSSGSFTMKVLSVAEKNDAAKSIADIISRGQYRKREGLSKYNKVYEFPCRIQNRDVTMSMTSVSGHLLNYAFVGNYKKWYACSPLSLFDAPVQKVCPEDYLNIKNSLEREIRGCHMLIIWTDCDREGENIGFEIINVCTAVKQNIQVYRAKFSEITQQSITRAIQNLEQPDKNTSDAVDVRQELDLRIGAAFTRFQTLRLQKVFPEVLSDQVISYGSCQFPTLGFVVERYKQVQAFVREPFWKISVSTTTENSTVSFNWKRGRLFDQLACMALYEHVIENPEATVMEVKSKPKSKWRPVALDTVELEKLASRKLRINAKETMRIAEKLYTQGYISYPRTETNIFPEDLNLADLVSQHTGDARWGDFAQRLLQDGITPRNGKKSDQAHPPIHPTKHTAALQGDEKRIYEFIVRHFLACCSQDALGKETNVEIDISAERFTAQALTIIAKNYLEVYPYDRWSDKILPDFHEGEQFTPTSIELTQGETTPPSLLTEADLITLMDKHGIGTDATHADHIEKIKSRLYVGITPDNKLTPGELGMGLVDGYDEMGFAMSKPHLRAELEADLKKICDGERNPDVVLREQIDKYREVFIKSSEQANKLDVALSAYFGGPSEYVPDVTQNVDNRAVLYCPSCGQPLIIKTKRDNTGYFLSCMGYPDCQAAVWLPNCVEQLQGDERTCDECSTPGKPVHKVKLKLKRGGVPHHMTKEHTACLGGCDSLVSEILDIGDGMRKAASTGSANRRQFGGTAAQGRTHAARGGSNNTNTRGASSTTRGATTTARSAMMGTTARPAAGATRTAGAANPRGSSTSSRGRGSAGSKRRGSTEAVPPAGTRNYTTATTTHTTQHPQLHNPPLGGRGGMDENRSINVTEDDAITCECGSAAALRTVRKEGPNTGREFYVCASGMDSKCSFFAWKEDASRHKTTRHPPPPPSASCVPLHPRLDASMNNEENEILCSCQLPAKLITVHKEGPNTGRQFYGCSAPPDARCQFFLWADQGPTTTTSSISTDTATGANNSTRFTNRGRQSAATCECGLNAALKHVQKDGPNKGRPFHSCPKSFGQGCSFFAWADEQSAGDQNAKRFAKPAAVQRADNTTKKTRACSICRQPGHTKKKCPHNSNS